MGNNYVGFVSESTKLHQDTFSEQIRISEDVNKYSTWFLGLSTVGVGLLIARFESISIKSWVGTDCIKTYLIVVGVMFFISITTGVAHNYLSIKERNCYRYMIAMLGPLRLVPFINLPEYYNDEIPDDLHNQISKGQYLGEKRCIFEIRQTQAKQLGKYLSTALIAQQILSVISYVVFFVLSIPK
jgi:hypothetical protein